MQKPLINSRGFRGDVSGMMRRGYEIHVHSTNFGLRRLCLRIPDRFAQPDQWNPYLLDDQIEWDPDGVGCGGALTLEPEGDAGIWWDDGPVQRCQPNASPQVPLMPPRRKEKGLGNACPKSFA